MPHPQHNLSRRGRTGSAPEAPGALLLALALVSSGCGSESPAPEVSRQEADILLITIDTLRADALGFAGNAEAETPVLDRLAAGGRIFDRAHAHSVTTLPSHASMLTGLYPQTHGARLNGAGRLGEEWPTAASILAEAGYRTAAFVAAFPLDSRFRLDRGFELYDDDLGAGSGEGLLYNERPGAEVVSRALVWWRNHAGARRFLWVHLFEPHAPYAPPEPFAEAFAHAPYLGEVAAADSFLEPLLAPFLDGREAPALVVVTSDHGEALGEHGEATHGLFAYEATLRVPLVLWGAGVAPGRDARPARLVDLLPTMLAAAGVAPPADLPGRSLLEEAGEDPGSYFEALSGFADYGWAPLRGRLQGELKYIDLPLPELYDLAADPAEEENLYARRRREARSLAASLPEEGWPPRPVEVPAEAARRLRSLGYAGGGGSARAAFTAEDDPKRLVHLDRKAGRMLDLELAGRRAEAIALGREILAERPAMGMVALNLANFLIEAGDPAAALEVLETAAGAGAARAPLVRQLGLSLLAAGRAGEARAVLEPLAAGSEDLEAKNHLALALAAEGRLAEAARLLVEALAREPGSARTLENLSYLALLRGEPAEAEARARQAVASEPSRASAWNNLGVALHRQGRAEEALAAWAEGLRHAPADPEILFNLGALELELGRRAEARETLRRFLVGAPGPAFEARRRQVEEVLAELEARSRRPSTP